MKYVNAVLAMIAIVLACRQSTKETKGTASKTDSLINNVASVAPSEYIEGATLITKNDCLTCHSIEKKVIGPSYMDIAKKYQFNEGNVDNLAHGIVYGSKGIWGEVAMTPHPNLHLEDAKLMVRYILTVDSLGK